MLEVYEDEAQQFVTSKFDGTALVASEEVEDRARQMLKPTPQDQQPAPVFVPATFTPRAGYETDEQFQDRCLKYEANQKKRLAKHAASIVWKQDVINIEANRVLGNMKVAVQAVSKAYALAAETYDTHVYDSLVSLKGLTAVLYKIQRIIGPLTARVEDERQAFNIEMQKARDVFRAALQEATLSPANISDLADFIGLNTVRRISSIPAAETRSRDNSAEDRPSRKITAEEVVPTEPSRSSSSNQEEKYSSGRERKLPPTSRSPARKGGSSSSNKRHRSPSNHQESAKEARSWVGFSTSKGFTVHGNRPFSSSSSSSSSSNSSSSGAPPRGGSSTSSSSGSGKKPKTDEARKQKNKANINCRDHADCKTILTTCQFHHSEAAFEAARKARDFAAALAGTKDVRDRGKDSSA